MSKVFDYKVIAGHLSEDELQELGQEGWELIAIVNDAYDKHINYFKKEIM